jgi:hypothetical protein
MFRAILGVALAVIPASFAAGQGGGPKGPPPRVMVVRVDGGRPPSLVVLQTVMVPVQVQEQVQVGKRIENRLQVKLVPLTRETRLPLDGEKVRVFDGNGKPVANVLVLKIIRQATPVLVSADGKEVDPFYLSLARPQTLVIVTPALAAPAAGAPMPVPPLPPPPPPKLPATGL